jgi:hypothetical protein
MRKLMLLLAALSMLLLVACDDKVNVDFAREAPFETYNTFAWAPTAETSLEQSYPLIHSRLKNTIEQYLTRGGMIEDTKDPDLYVTYHTSSKTELNVDTTHFGYGYGPGWGWYRGYYGAGMGSSTTTVREYERGTLIVDIWDARKKELVWRGSASGIIPEDPNKVSGKLDKFVANMVKEWEKIKRKQFPPESQARQ